MYEVIMNIIFIVSILFGISTFFFIKNILFAALLSIVAIGPMLYYGFFAKNQFEGPIKYSKVNAILVMFLSAIYLLESKVIVMMSSNLIYWLLALSFSSTLYDLTRNRKYLRVTFNIIYWVSLWRMFSIVFFINPNMQNRAVALSLIALFILFVSISSTLRIIRDKNEERSEGS
jgi:hypothetical protein